MSKFLVRKAAVLGAGVMGAQIAAHLANAGVQPVLFELAAEGRDKNANVRKALDGLAKLEPSPLATKSVLERITPANYDEHLGLLAECELVIEAISERMDWKKALFDKVAPHLSPRAIFASNTSGLSITELSNVLPEAVRPRFCGIHFFNPPRYMRLVEVIPTAATDPAIVDDLEAFLTTTLGKGVVRARDTPNFVANRVGVFSMLATMHHTLAFGLGFDEVDALTGPAIGRAKSATFRTADVVGLDTLAHVVKTMHDTLPGDPWHPYYTAPAFLSALIAKGALGQKTKGGIFVKKGKEIHVLDLAKQDYRPSAGAVAEEVQAILREKSPAAQFAKLRASAHPQAQFLWAVFRDLFHYSAVHLAEIAHCARDVDLAIRWGFGWKMGPFETWQAAGWQQVAGWIAEDIAAGKAMAKTPLPKWVTDGRQGVHGPQGSFSAADDTMHSRSTLPVYGRQLFPELVLGEKPADRGTTVFEDEGVRLWHQGDGIAIVSFRSKMHSLGSEVLAGLNRAIDEAEANYDALVIWHEAPFAVGANLKAALESLQAGRIDEFERHGRALPADLAAAQVQPRADRRGGRGHGAGRRLRVRDAFAARGGGAGELRRPGRGGRGPAARGRRPEGTGAARQRVGEGRRCLPGARAPLPAGGHGRRVAECGARARAGLPAARRRGGVPSRGAAARREAAGACHGAVGSPPAARAHPHSRGRLDGNRHPQDDAGEHEGGRLHLGARLRDRLAHRHRDVRRRGRARQPGGREVAAGPRAPSLRGAREDREDAGAHRAHAQDRQAAAQLAAWARLGAVLACLLFAVPFGGVGVFASWAIGSTVHASWKARSWVPVPAVVESASLHESSSSDGGDTYRADGSFRYAWNGRSYTGTRLGTSVIGGTDNFDDWHQEVSSRLKAARAAGQPVTVWVNPENPAEAVYERGIRWAELLFLTPFALAFGGVGVGALVAMVHVLRGKGSETGTQQGLDRALGTAGKGGQASARFLWIFAFFWNALSWPIAILVVRDVAASGEWLALIVLLFPLVGILVLWGAIATSWKSFREGRRGIEPPRPAPAASSFAAGAERAMFDRPAGTAAAGFPASGPSRLTLPAALADVEDTGSTLTIRYRTRRRLVPAVMLLVGGLFLSLIGVLIYLAGDSVFWAAVLVAVGAIVDVSAVGMLVGRLVVSAKAGELVVERRTFTGTRVSRLRADQIRAVRKTLSYSVNEEPYYKVVADLGAEQLPLGFSIGGDELADRIAGRIARVIGIAP